MSNICVVYHSVTGTTAKLAAAVVQGISEVEGCAGSLVSINGSEIVNGRYENKAALCSVDDCAAVVFACPTYMGGPSAQFKAFADASSERWEAQFWQGKICAGVTVGSSPSGDQLATIQYFTLLAAQHGMIWVGIDIPGGRDAHGRNRMGAQLGLVSQSIGATVPEIDLLTARYIGSRVARKTLALVEKRDA